MELDVQTFLPTCSHPAADTWFTNKQRPTVNQHHFYTNTMSMGTNGNLMFDIYIQRANNLCAKFTLVIMGI